MVNKITLKSLAVEISKTIASRDNVTKHDRNNSMDMTILETLHQIGHPEQGLPGVRPHILKMVKDGEITVFSSRGGLQPVQLSDVSESNFERWSTSNEDADQVRRKFNMKPQDAPEEDDGASANVELSEIELALDDTPVFHRKARCEVIPPALLALPADASIRFVDNIGGGRGEGCTRAGKYLQELTSIIKRQVEGFFTIDEAAQILAESSGGDVKTRKAKLWRAIKEGKLDVLDTDDRERVLDLNHVRDFIHLLRASDILAAGFIFPIQPQAVPVRNKSASGSSEHHWKPRAGELAKSFIERDKIKELYPNQLDLGDEVAKVFRMEGVMGVGGKPLTGAYIKRHALSGISSAQAKQLSTVIRRGK